MGHKHENHVDASVTTGTTGVVGAVETAGDCTPATPCPCNHRIDTAAPHNSAARTPVPGSQSCDTAREFTLRARQKLVRQAADQGAETQIDVAKLSLGVPSLLWSALGRPSVSNIFGLEAGFDGVAALKYMEPGSFYGQIDHMNPSIINGLIAIEINSLVDLVRLPLAITTTPKVAAWWRSRGDAETGVKFISRNKSKQESATPTSRDMSSLTRGPAPPSARKARSEKKKKRKKKR